MISQQIHCQSNHTSGIAHTTAGEGEGAARHLVLHVRKKQKVCRDELRLIRRLFQQQKAFGGDLISDNGGRMNWSIVPLEKPFLHSHYVPLLPENR